MQYCKNCGKQLKDGARFCDRCGQSVRQSRNSESSRKQEQIEKLQRERLARKKRQEQRENLENKRRERRRRSIKKNGRIIFAAVAVTAALIITSVISFIITSLNSDDSKWITNTGIQPETSASGLPTMQPSVTEAPSASPQISSKDSHTMFTLSNDMKIPYPTEFDETDSSGDEELRVEDGAGDAVMTVCSTEYPGGTPSDLMKSFAQKNDGKITYSLAGSGWYGITLNDGSRILHRKYIIDHENDLSVYYDFEYKSDSEYARDYEDYIDYIDKVFSIEKEDSR